jgi:zinc transporter, ZIP family
VSEATHRPAAAAPALARVLWLVAPMLLLALGIWWLIAAEPLSGFDNGAPPVENLTVERTLLERDGIRLLIRAGGSEPVSIAQVQVDDAYWNFAQEPAGPIGRGATAWLALPYPWVLGEAHAVKLVTSTGTTFTHEIAVAVPSPPHDATNLWRQAVLGLFVGLFPVAVGLMFAPALRNAGPAALTFILAVTVGLLAYLFVDTLEDALELAGHAAALFQGPALVALGAAASFLLLTAVARRSGEPTGLALAFYIALGIGLHNFGEGLAIGAAFAAGAAGLGAFLVIGFTLHNVTEGVGIAAPILREGASLIRYVALALIAGGPAVLGIWTGSLATAPQWSALALAIGAGAILQVVVEVTRFAARGDAAALFRPLFLAGLVAGAGVMYATAMLVKF